MQGLPVCPVCHLDTEWRQGIRIVRLFRKEADSLFDESEKGLLGREIALAFPEYLPNTRQVRQWYYNGACIPSGPEQNRYRSLSP